MPKLYVAGDSFACLSRTQDIGSSWSELLAVELNHELVNISRPGTSNESICIQIDWIANEVCIDDFIVIMLTDSFRKSFVNPDINLTEKHLLTYHSLHEGQRYLGEDIFQNEPYINVYTHLNAKTEDAKFFFKNMYNYTYQKYLDITLISGALVKLKTKTDKFLVVSGGFNDEIYTKPYHVTSDTFAINNSQFLDLSSSKILRISNDPKSYNHICIEGHKKISSLIYKFIAEWRRGISTGS